MADDGKNATFTAGSWGSMDAFCLHISRGMTVISSEDSGRYNRSLYVRRTTSGSFALTLTFRNHDEHQDFMNRMAQYARLLADPESGIPPMLVSVPSRNFLRTAIPTSGISFGDQAGRILHPATINFEGATDPLALNNVRVTQAPSGITDENKFFYPNELGGSVEDSLYDPSKTTSDVVIIGKPGRQ